MPFSADAELQDRQQLVARIAPLRTYSLLEMAAHLKRFAACQNTIDTVIAELPLELNERIQAILATRDYPLKFTEVGHVTLLFGYIARKIGREEIKYTSIQEYPLVLTEVKRGMIRKNQRELYQLCSEGNQQQIEALLVKEQFRIL